MIMHKRKPLALFLAQAIGAGSFIAASPYVIAQERERFTVTGSSISRTVTEGALPVLKLSRPYIEQSGATNATELIQSLPQVQNFVANSASVNGGGGGIATASLHALPSKYTLVLIDGMRPPASALSNWNGGGFAVNINSIPLDAVERVEILLDGATAVYGSDAIAGVVNFILKKNTTEGNAYAQYTWPTHGGGNGVDAGISKGFGDLQKDGFNIMGTLGYSHQEKLMASDRPVSDKGGLLPVHARWRELSLQQPHQQHRARQSYVPGTADREHGRLYRLFDQPLLSAEWQLRPPRWRACSPILPAPARSGPRASPAASTSLPRSRTFRRPIA